jgi:hypothetical protein
LSARLADANLALAFFCIAHIEIDVRVILWRLVATPL